MMKLLGKYSFAEISFILIILAFFGQVKASGSRSPQGESGAGVIGSPG